jgi:hypothetical protein
MDALDYPGGMEDWRGMIVFRLQKAEDEARAIQLARNQAKT